MIRRNFLKLLLASPLLGLLKKKEELTIEMLLESKAGLQLPLTTGTSDEEVLLGRVTFGDDSSITVPPGESWMVTKLEINDRVGYIYGTYTGVVK